MTSNTTKRIVSLSVVLVLAALSACTTQGPGNVNDNGTDNGTDNTNDNGTDDGIACVSGAEATVEGRGQPAGRRVGPLSLPAELPRLTSPP